MRYFLDELKGGAGPASRGGDIAKFRAAAGFVGPRVGTGTFEMYSDAWRSRGRPVFIDIDLPEPVEDAS